MHALRIPVLSVLSISALVAGCSGMQGRLAPKPPLRVKTQDQAGSTHVAVLSVAPWEEYMTALQPTFPLTPVDALNLAGAPTRALQDSFLDALKIGVGLRLEKSTDTRTRTTETAADGTRTRTERRVEEEGPADQTGLSAGPGLPATLAVRESAAPNDLGIDPMLQHLAATALYQEVQILNHYLQDAARRSGFKPYVVRLQVSVLPGARRLPYDTYLNIGFFSRSANGAVQASAEDMTRCSQMEAPGRETRWTLPTAQEDKLRSYSKPNNRPIQTTQQDEFNKLCTNFLAQRSFIQNPFVVPLVVTDNLESTLHSQTVEQLRQYAFSLMFLIQNVGGAADLQRFQQGLQKVFGSDLNSLLTVARLSDNTYRVRLGAMQQAETSYAMVPRTHNLTLLLLAPCDLLAFGSRGIEVRTRTQVADVEAPVSLVPRSPREVDADFKNLESHYGLDRTCLETLRPFAEHNRGKEFYDALVGKPCNQPTAGPRRNDLWFDLVSLLVRDSSAATSFELPVRPAPRMFPSGQVSLLLDDEKAAVAALFGAESLREGHLGAELLVDEGGKLLNFLPADKIVVSNDGHEARLSFPSPSVWGKAGKPMRLRITCDACGKRADDIHCDALQRSEDPEENAYTQRESLAQRSREFDVIHTLRTKKDEASPAFSMTLKPEFVWADTERKGVLTIEFRKAETGAPARIFFDVSGADIEDVTCRPGCLENPGSQVVVRDGVVRLTLANLTSKVVVTAGAKPGGSEVRKEVAVVRR
jgi:hypothetical protein